MNVRTPFAWLLLAFILSAIAVIWGDATYGISSYFYIKVDLLGLLCAALVIVTAALMAWLMPVLLADGIAAINIWRQVRPWHLAVVAMVLGVVGTHIVYQGYAFSMDEWMTRLQAEIFRSGHLSGVVPEEWREYGRAMYHSFAAYDPISGRVASDYRPGMAALYTFFDLFGLGLYTSSILNGLGVLLVALVSLRLWPGRRDIAVLAAFLVFSSQQALAAAMTSYAMSAHLCFNLLWLYLFLRNDWWGHIGAVLVGAATTALHQIHVHLFFALPFLFLLFRPFRPRLIVFYGLSYATSLAMVYSWDWWSVSQYLSASDPEARNLLERVLKIAHVPSWSAILTIYANVVRFIVWQNLVLVPMIVAAGGALVHDKWLRLLSASVLISLLPYLFLMPDQGHGWGYRYLHGLIGPVSLIGAYGGAKLLLGAKSDQNIAFLSLVAVASIVVMLPLRAWQIRGEVTPYVQATAFVDAQVADVVIVDSKRIFIGGDIPRNSAVSLSLPIQMHINALTAMQIRNLCRDYSVVYLGPEQFPQDFGLRNIAYENVSGDNDYLEKIEVLNLDVCRLD